MELGALVCTPRNPQCLDLSGEKTLRRIQGKSRGGIAEPRKTRSRPRRGSFVAFVIERDGKFLVRQRPAGIVNAHLWEFPNIEINGKNSSAKEVFKAELGFAAKDFSPLCHGETFHHALSHHTRSVSRSIEETRRKQPTEFGFRRKNSIRSPSPPRTKNSPVLQ